ncbi:gluconate 2-dehydrogenase subunit 3 family protein [Dyella jiangningensis]|uniref:Twin-arginine translocation pathway signal n=1 Tax=Dyella jiangningensis TaxID=1379159 RepID=A0A328P5D8_9GAMM|nr:gluconate 2-dehydrogenase subunit 3 family protein [Dyella jiangningensis]RAO76236.1 twin-arginine translocation pathway signal [Dyella jiangningensis]
MNRREWLKCVSALAVGTVAAPTLLAAFDAYAAAQVPGATPQFFTRPQLDLISSVVDIIIPRSDTPGAVDVGVPRFIDEMFANVYAKADQERYMSALAAFDQAGGKPFLQLSEAQRKALVMKLHAEALADPKDTATALAASSVLMNKKLAMMGFFLSQPGCTEVLQYSAVPGAYHADIPLAKAGNGKAWAVETVLMF